MTTDESLGMRGLPMEPADIQLAGLRIWIRGRQFPEHDDYWDGNFLDTVAYCGAAGAAVRVEGPIIHLGEIERWKRDLVRLVQTLSGEAALKCIEPELEVSVVMETLGHMKVQVCITPDQMTQSHRFDFAMDQTYIAPLIRQCSRILDTYPMRGKAPDRTANRT